MSDTLTFWVIVSFLLMAYAFMLLVQQIRRALDNPTVPADGTAKAWRELFARQRYIEDLSPAARDREQQAIDKQAAKLSTQ